MAAPGGPLALARVLTEESVTPSRASLVLVGAAAAGPVPPAAAARPVAVTAVAAIIMPVQTPRQLSCDSFVTRPGDPAASL